MDIRISKESDLPLRRQLAEQITFLIATGRIKAGETLPSVREMARRLKVHRNTVSGAYQDLVRGTWLVRSRGSRLVVAPRQTLKGTGPTPAIDLDDLINLTIRTARERGYSLQELRNKVRQRLQAEPPDHVLVVEEDAGLREIMTAEISAALHWPASGCCRRELVDNPGLAIGAAVVAGQYAIHDVESLVPKDRPPVALTFTAADDQVRAVQKLRDPSLIVVVSISEGFLRTARSVLAPCLGARHSLREILVPRDSLDHLRAVDLLFCDSVALRRVKVRKPLPYRLIAPQSLEYLASAFPSARDLR